MQEIPSSNTPEQALVNAEVILMWEDYFREDDAMSDWLAMAKVELSKLDHYCEGICHATQLPVKVDLVSRLALKADLLRLRMMAIAAEFSAVKREVTDPLK